MTTSVSNSSKVLKGISSQTIVTIVLGVVEIVSFSIMSRLLTQEDFGYYAAISAITTVFASFSETGIGSALIQRKEIDKRFVDNAFTLSLIFGLFISLLLFVLSGPLANVVVDSSMKVPLMLMSVTLLCHCLTSVNISLMQRKLQFLKVGLISLISLVVTTIVAIILAVKGFGYYAILVKSILTSILTLVLSYFFAHTHYGLALDKATFKSIFGFSGWLMASTFFRNFAHQADRLLMGRLLSVSALGAYNRPKEFITQISTKLNGIFDTALFPVLSGVQDNKKSLSNAYTLSFYYMNMFAMLLATIFIFNHELIIRIFLGEEWLSTKTVFVILSVALIFNIDGRLSDCYLRSLGLTKQQFIFRIMELSVRVVALLIGAQWKLVGVAVSVVLANFIMIVVKTLYIAHKVDVTAMQTLKLILSSWRFSVLLIPIMLLAYCLLPHSWLGNVVLAIGFVVISVMIFVFLPGLVGSQYKNEVYGKVIQFIKQKVHLRK